jgi:hypothetical protein
LKQKNRLKDNYNFLLKDEIKKRSQFNKRIKKIKRMRIKLKKITYHKLGINDEIEN